MKKAPALYGLVLTIGFCLWYLLYSVPLSRHEALLKSEIRSLEQRQAVAEAALASIDSHRDDIRNLFNSLDTLGGIFSGTGKVISIYYMLDSLCRQAPVRLEEISPSVEETVRFLRDAQQTDSSVTVTIRIKSRGDFFALGRLVTDIEQMRFCGRITYCRIQGSDELYPYCSLDFAFVAHLGRRLEMATID